VSDYHRSIISQALDSPELLTEWEVDFIDNVAEKDLDYVFSEKQAEILNRIEHKIALG